MPNYNNPYVNSFYMQDLQNMKDRIERQMQQYQQAQNQFIQPQQPPITQNFQLAPTQPSTELECKYANNIDEVKNTFVIKTGVFVNKDFSTMWVKDVTGNIKTYSTDEVVELDDKDLALLEKDKLISNLQTQIDELKGMMINANESNNTNINEPTTKSKSSKVSSSK